MTILSVSIRVHIHATEDRAKVIEAVRNILPSRLRDKVNFNSEIYEGHYGNKIEVLSLEIHDPHLSRELLENLVASMTDSDRKLLALTLHERVDKDGFFFLRLDKQSAYKGVLELSDGDDVIKIVFHLKGSREEAVRALREVLSR